MTPGRLRALPAEGASLALLSGRAVPAFDLGTAPGDGWAPSPAPGGQVWLRGKAPALPVLSPRTVPLVVAAGPPPAPPATLPPGRVAALDLVSPGGRLRLPLGLLRHILPLPSLHPIPGAPPEVLGWALADGATVLVVDPGGMAPAARHLVLLVLDGRLVGLPCAGFAPAAGDAAPPDLAPLRALLHWAPPDVAPVAAPAPAGTALLVAEAAGQRFALRVAEVTAAIAPTRPTALPGGQAVIAHRGAILPVLDAGRLLGLAPVTGAGRATPCLRLALVPPLALAVQAIEGLRRVDAIAPLAAGVMSGVVAWPGAAPIPLLGAARLAEAWGP